MLRSSSKPQGEKNIAFLRQYIKQFSFIVHFYQTKHRNIICILSLNKIIHILFNHKSCPREKYINTLIDSILIISKNQTPPPQKKRAPEATAAYRFVLSGLLTPADQHLEALRLFAYQQTPVNVRCIGCPQKKAATCLVKKKLLQYIHWVVLQDRVLTVKAKRSFV